MFPLEDLLQTVVVDSSDNESDSESGDMANQTPTQGQSDAAVRLKLLKAEVPDEQIPKGVQLTDLNCAINVKEKIEVNGENRLIQKRKTVQIEWDKCFDVAIIGGRVLQVLLQHEKTQVADATMRLEVLAFASIYMICSQFQDIANKCKHDSITHIWINLKPAGRILAQTRRVGSSAPPTTAIEKNEEPSRGLQRRRGAIKHQKVHEIRGHQFVATFFRQFTFCSICSEFMWYVLK